MINDQNPDFDFEENQDDSSNDILKNLFEDDEEIKNVLAQAQAQAESTQQFSLPFSSTSEDSSSHTGTSEIQNPKESFDLYYETLEKLLKKHLTHEGAKELIREQKCILLKDGHEKGRDGRQATTARMEEAIKIVKDWVRNTGGTDYPGLYESFYNRNVELGYITKGKRSKKSSTNE